MKINANGTEISVLGDIADENVYISLTDIAKKKNSDDPRIVISNWMSSYSTIDFLAAWERLYNSNFNRMEFQTVRSEPGRLIMTPKQMRPSVSKPDGIPNGSYQRSTTAYIQMQLRSSLLRRSLLPKKSITSTPRKQIFSIWLSSGKQRNSFGTNSETNEKICAILQAWNN